MEPWILSSKSYYKVPVDFCLQFLLSNMGSKFYSLLYRIFVKNFAKSESESVLLTLFMNTFKARAPKIVRRESGKAFTGEGEFGPFTNGL